MNYQYDKSSFLSGLSSCLSIKGALKEEAAPEFLIDFEYEKNEDGTYRLIKWKGTYNGKKSSICMIPNEPSVILELQDDWVEPEPEPEPEQQWETLFEGEVVTVEDDTYNGSSGSLNIAMNSLLFNGNEGIRLTVNGASQIYTAVGSNWGTAATIGNEWLYSGKSATVEDDGGDYLVYSIYGMIKMTELYTRNPGTYQIKIERALFEPMAYLYNGVRLPPLPERDKKKYPKAFVHIEPMNIVTQGAYIALVYFCSDTKTVLKEGWISSSDYIHATSYVRWLLYDDMGTNFWEQYPQKQWINEKIVDQSDFAELEALSLVKWSNYDIYHSDGTLFLTASEPVPVYE